MAVIDMGRFPGRDAVLLEHQPEASIWYRARHLAGLVARSHLVIIELDGGDRDVLVYHLTRIARLSREAGLDAVAGEAERLSERVLLLLDPDVILALCRLHAGILILCADARRRTPVHV